VLFGLAHGEPLAVMGADTLGRYRTGAASAVATKHLFGPKEFRFSVCGSGSQALTQVLAMAEVASLKAVSVWSPSVERRESFTRNLGRLGFSAKAAGSLKEGLASSDVATAITSSKEPFLTRSALRNVTHVNLCGSNSSERAEATPDAVGEFGTVAVDDIAQSKTESGDLIMAERRGFFSWENAVELKDIVSGRLKPSGRTLFKSNGVAIEDVAVASLLYDRAVRSGEYSDREIELGRV
jgi:ornithine cyclodeaminase/alanine dehydrogenase-like protein (mu-crystallin family)